MVNVVLNKLGFTKFVLQTVHKLGERYGTAFLFASFNFWTGTNTKWAGKTVVVEYSSPNIAKPFHCGHLRSTIIGNVLKHLYKAFGANVIGINYLGDWGKQYGTIIGLFPSLM